MAALQRVLKAVVKQLAVLREDEAKDDCWYMLPDPEDASVNYTNFDVHIDGPESYEPSPTEEPRKSPYAGGLFCVSLSIPADFPTGCPSVVFRTRIWHPLIAEDSGKPCQQPLKEYWDSLPAEEKTLGSLLRFVRRILQAPQLLSGDSVNSSAKTEMDASLDAFDEHAARETAKYAAPS